jgi:hypothetical protein
MSPLYNTYEAKTLRSKLCKDKQNQLLKLIFSKLGWSETLSLQQPPLTQN